MNFNLKHVLDKITEQGQKIIIVGQCTCMLLLLLFDIHSLYPESRFPTFRTCSLFHYEINLNLANPPLEFMAG